MCLKRGIVQGITAVAGKQYQSSESTKVFDKARSTPTNEEFSLNKHNHRLLAQSKTGNTVDVMIPDLQTQYPLH